MLAWLRDKIHDKRTRVSHDTRFHSSVGQFEYPQSDVSDRTQTARASAARSQDGSLSAPNVVDSVGHTTGTMEKEANVPQITVIVLSPYGGLTKITLPITSLGSDLKIEALKKFGADKHSLPFYSSNDNQMYNKYKIIKATLGTPFDESQTLEKSDIQENDEFSLIMLRNDVVPESVSLKSPTQAAIDAATRDMVVSDVRPKVAANIDDMVLQNDIQYDIRKILISLAQAAAYIIGVGPYAERLIVVLKQKLINRRNHEADAVQCLVDMGFPEDKAVHALRLKNNVYAAALDFLIENQSSMSLVGGNAQTSNLSHKLDNLSLQDGVKGNVDALLEIVRIHSNRYIPPPPEMVQALLEMGFEKDAILDALKQTKNNEAAACEWLVGNRNPSITELRDGLSSDSPVLQALLNSPHVQMSLRNPKMFVAYISLLENHSSLTMWLADSETSTVISHILRTYHEEKHITAINQFSATVNS